MELRARECGRNSRSQASGWRECSANAVKSGQKVRSTDEVRLPSPARQAQDEGNQSVRRGLRSCRGGCRAECTISRRSCPGRGGRRTGRSISAGVIFDQPGRFPQAGHLQDAVGLSRIRLSCRWPMHLLRCDAIDLSRLAVIAENRRRGRNEGGPTDAGRPRTLFAARPGDWRSPALPAFEPGSVCLRPRKPWRNLIGPALAI